MNQLRLELATHGYNSPPSWEKNQIKAKIQATLTSCSSIFDRFGRTEQEHLDQLVNLERNFLPIQLLSTQSNQKNLTIRKQNSLVGWIPHQDKYVLIQNTTCPSESEIMRHIAHEPETNLTNLPLSIHGLLLFADKIGATDQLLLTMLSIYLKKYKPNLLDVLDAKKNNIGAVIESLAFHCTIDNERTIVLEKLRRFRRKENESFAACIIRFDTLFVFYLQLEQPSEAEVIRMLSHNTICQLSAYLLSPKCAHAFGAWVRENQMVGIVITKEDIIRFISELETHVEFKNTQPRQIPGHLISTTLNLPPAEAEITLSAHVATPSLPKLEQPRQLQSSRSASQQSRNSSSRPTSRGRDKNQDSRRKTSQSRERNRNESRGRSPGTKNKVEKKAVTPASRNNSLCAEMEACQYYSVHSQSPNRRKVSIPSVFRRPLTPRSLSHMKGNYFLETSGEKFQDVRASGRCLRCYSDKHRAAMCKRFTRPTPTPCKKCHYLFHPTESCHNYTSENRSRGPSANRSLSRTRK